VKHFISKAPMYELPIGANGEERRRIKRHPLRSRALVGIQGQPSLRGSMIDISTGGVSLTLPVALPAGTECMVFFTVTVAGQLIAVSGAGKVANSICSSEGFRIGMRFSTQDPQAQRALQKLLGEQAVTEAS
jgi:c-di-GMP-binding flagellar brake protein YcgR